MDTDLLERHRSFSDHRLGVAERFVDLELSSGRTVGVLSTPLDGAREVGWVICHGFGTEQVDLQATDAAVARAVAAAGYPVLRFHSLGYGDSEDVDAQATSATHAADTGEVAQKLPHLAGVDRVGVVGARFGGAVAALVADALDLPYLVMLSPVLNGGRYMNELLRSRVIVEMLAPGQEESSTVEDLRTQMERDGLVDIKGFALHKEVVDEISRLNVPKALSRFSGQALVVQVSRGETVQIPVRKLLERLEQVGGHPTLEVVNDPFAAHFGYEHFQAVEGAPPGTLADSLARVNERLARTVVEWIRTSVEGAGGAGG